MIIRRLLENEYARSCTCEENGLDPSGHADECNYPAQLGVHGEEDFRLLMVAEADLNQLHMARRSYGNSWSTRGGVGAFMNLARKWDRLSGAAERQGWDVFTAILNDPRSEGTVDDLRDLRHYTQLIEVHLMRHFGLEPQLVKEVPVTSLTNSPRAVPVRDDDPPHPEPCEFAPSCEEPALPNHARCEEHQRAYGDEV